MQLTIDVDKHFIENLKEEFQTTNIKDALVQLVDRYKNRNNNLNTEIENRIRDYINATLETSEFHEGLNEIRESILKVK